MTHDDSEEGFAFVFEDGEAKMTHEKIDSNLLDTDIKLSLSELKDLFSCVAYTIIAKEQCCLPFFHHIDIKEYLENVSAVIWAFYMCESYKRLTREKLEMLAYDVGNLWLSHDICIHYRAKDAQEREKFHEDLSYIIGRLDEISAGQKFEESHGEEFNINAYVKNRYSLKSGGQHDRQNKVG